MRHYEEKKLEQINLSRYHTTWMSDVRFFIGENFSFLLMENHGSIPAKVFQSACEYLFHTLGLFLDVFPLGTCQNFDFMCEAVSKLQDGSFPTLLSSTEVNFSCNLDSQLTLIDCGSSSWIKWTLKIGLLQLCTLIAKL